VARAIRHDADTLRRIPRPGETGRAGPAALHFRVGFPTGAAVEASGRALARARVAIGR